MLWTLHYWRLHWQVIVIVVIGHQLGAIATARGENWQLVCSYIERSSPERVGPPGRPLDSALASDSGSLVVVVAVCRSNRSTEASVRVLLCVTVDVRRAHRRFMFPRLQLLDWASGQCVTVAFGKRAEPELGG